MQIRSLGGVSWDELAPVFNDAFSDYAVPMVMTAESLANMQRRRGYVADVSFGAYDGSRLVAPTGSHTVPSNNNVVSIGVARWLRLVRRIH